MEQSNGLPRVRRVVLAAGAALAITAGVALPGIQWTAHAAESAPQQAAVRTPQIFPKPRSVTPQGGHVTVTPVVTLIAGASADPSAIRVTEELLRAAGAHDIVRADHPVEGENLTVYVGGPDETPGSAHALSELGLPGVGGLPAEGYELGAGQQTIVLAGADHAGTFYAAQTLRQIVLPEGKDPQRTFAGLAVRDWPSTPLRGTIEGFYGTPWSDPARLDILDFSAAHKMNIYVYSPKDDPYLRAKWRDQYPADKLAVIKSLSDRATVDHMAFTYALSPGLDVCYSSDADEKALVAKFQSLWDIGVRSFSIPLDDIGYNPVCASDKTKFGTNAAAAGAAQSYLLNRVQKDFIDTHAGAKPLQTVPIEYADTGNSTYKTALREQLDPRVLMGWTGEGVIAGSITTAQAQQAEKVFGHKILLWDNYPVNDYLSDRLLLAPYTGREAGVAGQLAGLTANPMNQSYASRIALFTVADYLWNAEAYEPQSSWAASLSELAGGDPATTAALRAFADLNTTSPLQKAQAPELAAAIKEFWAAWPTDPVQAVHALRPRLTAVAEGPAVLRADLAQSQQGFLTDAAPWLDSAADWGTAMVTALDMLKSQQAGDAAGAWADRQALPGLVKAASTHPRPGTTQNVRVGDRVVDAFVKQATKEYDAALGIKKSMLSVTYADSQETVGENAPATNAVDGDPDTFWHTKWSGTSDPMPHEIQLNLGADKSVSCLTYLPRQDNGNGRIAKYEVYTSKDGTNWGNPVATGTWTNTAEEKKACFTPVSAHYVRLRALSEVNGNPWTTAAEINVVGGANSGVSGSPAAAQGSSLEAVADGDLDTAYRADGPPANGDALVVKLPEAKSLDSVLVLQPGDSRSKALVQVKDGDAWRTIGALSGPYTRLPAHGIKADTVRLLWKTGSPAPVISEVVARTTD
ncbi:beta-N-acetylglucosaminidase domain-containing protein [Streptomyces sp. NBC_01669]|uniref:beta-N-acetylglucosaminidase domain-containing protein n=1 Tax=Streptomyces sp. NBC_01669 TaxID=2975909 RepID=UPI00224D5F55|nr:beta-N-acetylglucosaminidase domain-containing protein [Streptomyces sp. NBC_01669]MCX4537709.1 beta-N-acetylglucosaminidase domain-containing protein [Streptomyces sp. NBC_01669]